MFAELDDIWCWLLGTIAQIFPKQIFCSVVSPPNRMRLLILQRSPLHMRVVCSCGALFRLELLAFCALPCSFSVLIYTSSCLYLMCCSPIPSAGSEACLPEFVIFMQDWILFLPFSFLSRFVPSFDASLRSDPTVAQQADIDSIVALTS